MNAGVIPDFAALLLKNGLSQNAISTPIDTSQNAILLENGLPGRPYESRSKLAYIPPEVRDDKDVQQLAKTAAEKELKLIALDKLMREKYKNAPLAPILAKGDPNSENRMYLIGTGKVVHASSEDVINLAAAEQDGIKAMNKLRLAITPIVGLGVTNEIEVNGMAYTLEREARQKLEEKPAAAIPAAPLKKGRGR